MQGRKSEDGAGSVVELTRERGDPVQRDIANLNLEFLRLLREYARSAPEEAAARFHVDSDTLR